jgi:regulator of protease activity HflC (stomatin/prohibitin superfamily)
VAQVTLAEASARSIQKVAEAMGQDQAPLYYLLGEKYIHGVTQLAESQNSKIVVLPADLQESLRGLLGRK